MPSRWKKSGDPDLDLKIQEWLEWDKNELTHAQIVQLKENKDWNELRQRLMKRIEFGTAGLRAPMRAGFDSMNDLVIVQTVQGLCSYVMEQFHDEKARRERGIIIGYDARYNSRRYAEITASVFLQHGIKVWFYSQLVPTPFVSFGVLQLKCLAGVMVTGSQYPKGIICYKVYWTNGAQIIPPHEKGIQQTILRYLEPEENSWRTDILRDHPLVADPYKMIFAAYYKKLQACLPRQIVENNTKGQVRFVYTALHGVGYAFVIEAFKRAKLKPVLSVALQKNPNSEFPTITTLSSDEDKNVLELAMKHAVANKVYIVLANSPDAGCLTCAERNRKTEEWKVKLWAIFHHINRKFQYIFSHTQVFTGNELGTLLGWWALQNYKELKPTAQLSQCYMIASTLSSRILGAIGKTEGFNFVETLPGFKWIGNCAVELVESGQPVIFAFENSTGFMFSTNVLEGDGVSAACHLATMANWLKSTTNCSLTQKLNQIYTKYGYHISCTSYFLCYKPDLIRKIFKRLRYFQNGERNTFPTEILEGKYKIHSVRDLTTGVDTAREDKIAVLPHRSTIQMITFTFEDGLVITLRARSTDPKIEYHAEMRALPDQTNWHKVRCVFFRMLDACIDEFYQPERYEGDIIPKTLEDES